MAYAVFDIETRIDKRLVNETLYRGRELADEAAFDDLRRDLVERRGSDFFPLSFHIPISIALGLVGDDRLLQTIESLAAADYSEEGLVREFWERVEGFENHCLISFNGRQFDLPVLELQALRYGCVAKRYFGERGPRHRHAPEQHFDLYDFITNYGAYRVRGGFDLLLRGIGLPGKGEIDGSRVQALWEGGRLDVIHAYCRRDVVQTYFLFLRVELLRGNLSPQRYQELMRETEHFRRALEQV
ncbi:MAG: ribonuclease H-like domain-containing protein [Candidatus Binatia bacterium]